MCEHLWEISKVLQMLLGALSVKLAPAKMGSQINIFFLFLNVNIIVDSIFCLFCVEVLQPSQPNGVMSSMVSLPNHAFTRLA